MTHHRLPTMDTPFQTGTCLDYCGPALVLSVLDRDVELQIQDARRWARLAIALTYQPVAGDIVLALACGPICYVVGILEGSGPTVLDAPGDLELRARDGEIRITAAQACVVTAPAVRVEARALDLLGDTLREEFETVRRRITGALEVRAKAIRTLVSETWRLTAHRVVARGEASVTVDAPSVMLG